MKKIMSKLAELMLTMWDEEDREYIRSLFKKGSLNKLAGRCVAALGIIYILGAVGNDDMLFEMGLETDLIALVLKIFIGAAITALGVYVSRLPARSRKAVIIPLETAPAADAPRRKTV